VGMMARFKKIKIDSHLLVSELNNVVVNISSEKANRLVIGLNETQSKINFSIANLKSKSINDVSK
jgi:pentose-5-phosphate-3-epimerase